MTDDKTRKEFEEAFENAFGDGEPFCWPFNAETGNYKAAFIHRPFVMWQAAKERYGQRDMPEVLFDGYAVFKALSEEALECTTSQNVAFVLDAIVRILREEATKEQKHEK